jgi:hypothetical protein
MAHQAVNPFKQDYRHIVRPPLLDFKSRNDIISANCYCQTLRKLHAEIKNDCQGKLTDSITCFTTLPVPMWPKGFRTN